MLRLGGAVSSEYLVITCMMLLTNAGIVIILALYH